MVLLDQRYTVPSVRWRHHRRKRPLIAFLFALVYDLTARGCITCSVIVIEIALDISFRIYHRLGSIRTRKEYRWLSERYFFIFRGKTHTYIHTQIGGTPVYAPFDVCILDVRKCDGSVLSLMFYAGVSGGGKYWK